MGGFSINNRTIAIVGLIIATVLFAYSRMPGGIGGTGVTGAPGGIGGTGIYGRIDGFGSIWVNGVEIFYDEDQNVVRQGRDGLPNNLKIGQIVAVIINEEPGRAQAQSIEIIEEVNGPIEKVADDKLTILGQKVILTDDTIIEGDLEAGRQMAVNGFRAPDGSIIASRIDTPLVEGEVSLRGSVSRLENGRFWINEQELETEGEQVIVGNTVEVRGRLGSERGRIIINNFKKRRLPFDKRPARISYQAMFNNAQGIDIDRPLPVPIETTVIEFSPTISEDVLVIPRLNDQIRTDFRNNFKRERIAQKLIERLNEIQAVSRREAENEARRQVECEARRQTEIEVKRQREIEATQQVEIEVRSQTEIDARRQGEVEARRQAEVEARQQGPLEVRQLPDFEARRQAQLEVLKQTQSEARSETQQETLRQIEGEIRRKTEGDLKEEIRGQVRSQSREEIRETIRQEVRRRARRELRQGGIQP